MFVTLDNEMKVRGRSPVKKLKDRYVKYNNELINFVFSSHILKSLRYIKYDQALDLENLQCG